MKKNVEILKFYVIFNNQTEGIIKILRGITYENYKNQIKITAMS